MSWRKCVIEGTCVYECIFISFSLSFTLSGRQQFIAMLMCFCLSCRSNYATNDYDASWACITEGYAVYLKCVK